MICQKLFLTENSLKRSRDNQSVTTCSRVHCIKSQSQVVNYWTLYRQSCWYRIDPSGLFYYSLDTVWDTTCMNQWCGLRPSVLRQDRSETKKSVSVLVFVLYALVLVLQVWCCVVKHGLHWLSVPQRVKFKLGTMMHSCLHNSAPRYLCDYCIPIANVAARSQLRSASHHQVVVPRYNTSTFGRPAFSVAGPTVWNSLPDKLRDPSLSIDSFRRQLETFLLAD